MFMLVPNGPNARFLNTAANFMGRSSFTPAKLFASGEIGVWYDPSDLTTLFQDAAGTTPVTAAGQSVGLVLDKSGRGNHATQATAASRPLYQVDASGRGYLAFDGVDDFLVTPKITPGTDKVQVFAGVRKLSDAAIGMVVENGNAVLNAFQLYSNNAPSFVFVSRGSLTATVVSVASFAAPISAIVSGIGDISGDVSTIRANGASVTSAADQGTGNFAALPLYIGRRGGTSLPFNGHLYGLQVRFGANLTEAQIAQAERWMAARTGVTI